MSIKSAISPVNWLDLSSSSVLNDPVSEQITALPMSNAQLEEVNQVWGLTVDASQNQFTRVFNIADGNGNSRQVGVFSIVFAHRIDGTDRFDDQAMFAATDQIRVRGYSEIDAGGNELFDSGLVNSNVDPKINYWTFVVPDSDVSAKSIELFLSPQSKVGTSNQFLWTSRLWAGPLIRLQRSFQTGHRKRWSNNEYGEVRRASSYPFNRVKDTLGELRKMEEFEQLTNTKHQFLFVENSSNASDTTVIGKRPETTGFQSQFFRTYGFTLRQEETW